MPRRHLVFGVLNVFALVCLSLALRLGWQPDAFTALVVLVAFVSADVVLWWSLGVLDGARRARGGDEDREG